MEPLAFLYIGKQFVVFVDQFGFDNEHVGDSSETFTSWPKASVIRAIRYWFMYGTPPAG